MHSTHSVYVCYKGCEVSGMAPQGPDAQLPTCSIPGGNHFLIAEADGYGAPPEDEARPAEGMRGTPQGTQTGSREGGDGRRGGGGGSGEKDGRGGIDRVDPDPGGGTASPGAADGSVFELRGVGMAWAFTFSLLALVTLLTATPSTAPSTAAAAATVGTSSSGVEPDVALSAVARVRFTLAFTEAEIFPSPSSPSTQPGPDLLEAADPDPAPGDVDAGMDGGADPPPPFISISLSQQKV